MFVFCFFFSSRRRHTRLQGDWSSDVCSSDLIGRAHVKIHSHQWDQVRLKEEDPNHQSYQSPTPVVNSNSGIGTKPLSSSNLQALSPRSLLHFNSRAGVGELLFNGFAS